MDPEPAVPVVAPARRVASWPMPARSLLSPAGLRAAVGVLEGDVPGRVRTLRVEPARVDVQVVAAGRLLFGRLELGGSARVVSSLPAAQATSTFGYDAVDPGAPRRLIRAGARRLGRPARDVHYVFALEAFPGELQWLAYWRGGGFATGDAAGALLRVAS